MRVIPYATVRHYRDHIDPIMDALPAEHRGPLSSLVRRVHPGPDDMVLVAGWQDAVAMRRWPLVYVEHGVGQTYGGEPATAARPGWPGYDGPGLSNVRLFIAPSDRVAAMWRRAQPHAAAVAVGCPKLDKRHEAPTKPRGQVVAVTWHWDLPFCPETMSAAAEFMPVVCGRMRRWADEHGVEIIGHGHPRRRNHDAPRYERAGIEYVADFEAVMDRADVLVGDNTSVLYEFASLDRPVVAVNASGYRRDVHHGLRFWDAVPGRQVDHPSDLIAAVAAALDDPTADADERHTAVSAAYAACDGLAAHRAAEAIMKVATHVESQGTVPEAQ